MIKAVFNRFEQKYFLTHEQIEPFVDFLHNFLVFDAYSENKQSYSVYNYYFDNDNHDVIRHSLSSPAYKEKVRLRYYDKELVPSSLVFLEIKKKLNKRVNKRRVQLTYQEFMDYYLKNTIPTFESYIDEQVFKEIDHLIKLNQIKPSKYISYQRIALLSKENELRVTIDFDLTYGDINDSLEVKESKPILNNDKLYLVEIKSESNIPLWLSKKLNELNLYKQRFSKYGTAYLKDVIERKENEYLLYLH